MTFHGGKRATDDVSTDSHDKKLAVRLNQRRNSPECDDREHEQKPAAKSELTGDAAFRAEKSLSIQRSTAGSIRLVPWQEIRVPATNRRPTTNEMFDV